MIAEIKMPIKEMPKFRIILEIRKKNIDKITEITITLNGESINLSKLLLLNIHVFFYNPDCNTQYTSTLFKAKVIDILMMINIEPNLMFN